MLNERDLMLLIFHKAMCKSFSYNFFFFSVFTVVHKYVLLEKSIFFKEQLLEFILHMAYAN